MTFRFNSLKDMHIVKEKKRDISFSAVRTHFLDHACDEGMHWVTQAMCDDFFLKEKRY